MFKRKAGSLVSALIAALVSALLFVLLMLVMRVYPFGDNTLLFGDGDRFVSLFASVPDIISQPEGVFYSWSAAMGSDMTELSAAYLFSPLNLLSLLFRNNPLLGFHIAAGLRTSLASAAFCLWLSRKEGLHIWSRTLMGVMYGFSGFTISCLANSSMTDGAVLLPLICIGVNRLLEGKGIMVYTVTLALAVLTGYRMISVFFLASILFWLRGVFEEKGSWTKIRRTIVPWGIGTVLAMGVSACVILPVWLTAHPNASFSIPQILVLDGDPRLILSGLFTGNMTASNIPPVFAGVIALMLAILYFFNGAIAPRRKAAALIALALASATFIVPIPYVFRNNVVLNQLDTRCSVLLIFLLTDMSAESRGRLEDLKVPGYVCGGIAGAALFACVIMFMVQNGSLNMITAVTDGILIAAAVGLAWVIGTKKNRTAGLALSLLAIANMLENSWFVLHEDTKSSPASVFYDLYDKTEGALQLCADKDMYRVASLYSWGRNDALLHGYAAADGYLPGQKMEGPAYADMLGIDLLNNSSVYAETGILLPESADGLLSLRYLLTREEGTLKAYQNIGSYSGVTVYENPYALPLITAAEELPKEAGENVFEKQNLLWKSASGKETDVFKKTECKVRKNVKDVTVTATGSGKALYMYLPAMHGEAEVTGADDAEIVLLGKEKVIPLGVPAKGKTVTVTVKAHDAEAEGYLVYEEDTAVLKQMAESAGKNAVRPEKLSPSHLKGTCTIPKGKGYLLTTIPYDTGWNITVDGRTAVAGADLNGMLSVAVTEGNHMFEMIYRPAGFVMGLIITAISLMLFIIFLFIHHGWLRKYRAQDREKAEAEKQQELAAVQNETEGSAPEGEEAAQLEAPGEETPVMPLGAPYVEEVLPGVKPEEEIQEPEVMQPEEPAEIMPELPETDKEPSAEQTGFFSRLFGHKKPEQPAVPEESHPVNEETDPESGTEN